MKKGFLWQRYEAFDDLEDKFLEKEEQFTALVAQYVDDHLAQFATIV